MAASDLAVESSLCKASVVVTGDDLTLTASSSLPLPSAFVAWLGLGGVVVKLELGVTFLLDAESIREYLPRLSLRLRLRLRLPLRDDFLALLRLRLRATFISTGADVLVKEEGVVETAGALPGGGVLVR